MSQTGIIEGLTVVQAQKLANQEPNCIIVDVRSAGEFKSLHAQPAINIPLEQIAASQSLQQFKDKKVLCICQSGMRSKRAVEALKAAGLEQVLDIQGGTTAWAQANLPVVKGQGSISIERQVRIIAGALVFLGAMASYFLSVEFALIPAFVGFGLMFAGITDFCGMALVLARCPWNRG